MLKLVRLALAVILVTGHIDASALRPITVEDCVRTRRIVDGEVRISPDRSEVAYVVKAPNLETNRNDFQLYVRELGSTDTRQNGRVLLRADRISGIRWAGPGRVMALSETRTGGLGGAESGLEIVSTTTGTVETLELPANIHEFSASADGNKIVFSVKAPIENVELAAEKEKVWEERGFPIASGEGLIQSREGLPTDEIFLAVKEGGAKFDIKRLDFREPGHAPFLRDVSGLDLSPDGKYLLMKRSSDSLPRSWEGEGYLEYLKGLGTPFYSYVLLLYEIDTGMSRVAFNFPGGLLSTEWSNDSRSYAVVGPSPFGTDDAKAESARFRGAPDMERQMARFEHVFTVATKDLETTKVVDRRGRNLESETPLYWEHEEGPMLVRTDAHALAWTMIRDGEWNKAATIPLPVSDGSFSSLQSDGKTVLGVYQTAMIPPDLFLLDLKSGKWALLTDLNPDYGEIELGRVEPIAWTNRYGSDCGGFLIKPVGYEPGNNSTRCRDHVAVHRDETLPLVCDGDSWISGDECLAFAVEHGVGDDSP
jgi:dipeptidyl aminopeptidase/acylaminoacyl peptidase